LGLNLGPAIINEFAPNWQPWIFIILGTVLALLSIVLKKLMITVSGAFGLGTLVYLLTQPNFLGWASILLTIIGAIVGLLIAWFLFDRGLMVFSALTGGAIISSVLSSFVPQISTFDGFIFLVLFMLGLIIQIVQWTNQHTRETISNTETSIGSEEVA
jgi:hypothetical protein